MNAKPESLSQLNLHLSATLSNSDALMPAWDSVMLSSNTETSLTKNSGKRKYRHTPEQIAQELRIDEYGRLFWLTPKQGRRLDRPINTIDKNGYIRFVLPPATYTGHVLAWVLYYGSWPDANYDIDHINGIKVDNRKENLRLVTRSQNNLNSHRASAASTSGFPGVSFSNSKNKWRAYININHRQIFGGYFATKEQAIAARCRLEIQYEHLGGKRQ